MKKAIFKKNRFIALNVITLSLMACGGGESNSNNEPSDNTSPVASNFLPVNNDTNVEPESLISTMFDEDLFALTLSTSSVTLTDDSNNIIPLNVAYDETNKLASLTPVARLALMTHYTVKLTTDITDLAGNELADTTWQFTTRDGSWDVNEVVISDDEEFGLRSNVQVAYDDNNTARAVWSDQTEVLWANDHVYGDDWGSPTQIGLTNGRARQPQLAINNTGDAFVVWNEYGNSGDSIWSNRYAQNSGWGTPTSLEAAEGSASGVQIATDDNGNAMAVWTQQTNGVFHIFANKYTALSGWETPQQIENIYTNVSASAPKIVMSGTGNALIVWKQTDTNISGQTFNIWSARYTASEGWALPQIVERDLGISAYPEIAIDGDDNVMMVWEQQSTNRTQIWSNRYSVDNGWGQAQAIENNPYPTNSAFAAQVSVNRQGDAIAVWYQRTLSGEFDVWSNRYTIAEGWGTEQLIEDNDLASAEFPQVSLDNEGNALAVFELNSRIWANRYIATEGWQTAEEIDRDVLGASIYPRIAVNNKGEAMALWVDSRSAINVSNIRMNHFR